MKGKLSGCTTFWLIWSVFLVISCCGIVFAQTTLESFLSDNDPIYDLLKLEDDGFLLNIMDPSNLYDHLVELHGEDLQILSDVEAQSIDSLDTYLYSLNVELENLYQRLFHIAKVLAVLSKEEIINMADSLIHSQEYYSLLEPGHVHREPNAIETMSTSELDDYYETDSESSYYDEKEETFNFIPDELLITANSTLKTWDPDSTYELLLNQIEKGETDDTIEVSSILGILKKLKKKLKKIEKKFFFILKLIKLKKIVRKKKIKACLKIMLTIEKIKKCLMLIKALFIKLIRYSIKELPFDVLWKLKVVLRLFLKVVDDVIWSTEIKIIEAIVISLKLINKIKSFPFELIAYLKLELADKLGITEKRALKQKQDHSEEIWNQFYMDQETFSGSDYEYEDDDDDTGLDFVESDYKIKDELDELYENMFTESELENFLQEHNLFNFDVSFEDENSFDNYETNAKSVENLVKRDFEQLPSDLSDQIDTNTTFSDELIEEYALFLPNFTVNTTLLQRFTNFNLTVLEEYASTAASASFHLGFIVLATVITSLILRL